MLHTIVILAIPGVQLLDVAGPFDAFAEANRLLHRQIYQPVLMSLEGKHLLSSSGVTLNANARLSDFSAPDNVSFLIAGAPDIGEHTLTERHIAGIPALSRQSARHGNSTQQNRDRHPVHEPAIHPPDRPVSHWLRLQCSFSRLPGAFPRL